MNEYTYIIIIIIIIIGSSIIQYQYSYTHENKRAKQNTIQYQFFRHCVNNSSTNTNSSAFV